MNKPKKISISALIGVALAMCMSLSVFAATTRFTGYLPAYQGDTEISTVRKETSTAHFTIEMLVIDGTDTDKVCAWTEGDSTGYNYSSPYNQVAKGELTDIDYSHVPDIGENVVLNLDNPVSLDHTVAVGGDWSPN